MPHQSMNYLEITQLSVGKILSKIFNILRRILQKNTRNKCIIFLYLIWNFNLIKSTELFSNNDWMIKNIMRYFLNNIITNLPKISESSSANPQTRWFPPIIFQQKAIVRKISDSNQGNVSNKTSTQTTANEGYQLNSHKEIYCHQPSDCEGYFSISTMIYWIR